MRLLLIYRFQKYINIIQLQEYGHHTQNHVTVYVILTKTVPVYGLSLIHLFHVVGKKYILKQEWSKQSKIYFLLHFDWLLIL